MLIYIYMDVYVCVCVHIHKTFSSLTYKYSPCVICYHDYYHRVFLRWMSFFLSNRERERERANK